MNLSSLIKTIVLSLILYNVSTIPQAVYAQNTSTSKPDSSKIKEALRLIRMPEPEFNSHNSQDIKTKHSGKPGFKQVYQHETITFTMRDGATLYGYKYPKKSNLTIILIPGVLSSGLMLNRSSGLLRDYADAEVIALDLRGHGQSDGTPGDVDYIGQYEDDLTDVISEIRTNDPRQKIIIAGHSMGGGIALRYAMKQDVPEVSGYLLFAPLLGANSPTIPSSDSNNNTGSFMKVDIHRIVGIFMLDQMGIHDYDALPVLFFNLPENMPLRTYTYRAYASMAPANFKEGLRAVNKPLLVLVGENDEAFVAFEFKPVVQAYSDGKTVIINGATHKGILYNISAMKVIKKWVQSTILSK